MNGNTTMGTLLRASMLARTILPRTTTRALRTTPNKATTLPSSTPINPTLTNKLDQEDAGNYLTGASTLSLGDAVFLLVGGSMAFWIGNKAIEEVKDVVWPELKWVGKKVVGKDGEGGEGVK
ncbi:hypothetical protein M409DRAFT_27928 [Zasmidium cellare ATCC 36951]|uniref:Uncharacterized protein n=1 Tax=Zasmidium cellare ATCC 36951 TaxID=1080233 RepID=A0A6A6C5Q6_ZASCE|nr:uncharacterized protein M409DRAFT_27928 [Zasmidium cellare ATCC 36951]KAF2161530.1 hypothetical protein M409DRAFT_27928 [Zasmidium cellare ATCC 36951]